ncbi:MAG: hypothetical protein J6O04_12075 [Selenomonadaceae bacterium]|nr:hypothetical protein [Selenomonadaceae bacterium]
MKEVATIKDSGENSFSSPDKYGDIKPSGEITATESKEYFSEKFNENLDKSLKQETAMFVKVEKYDKLEKTTTEYFEDLKEKSEFPETIPEKPFEVSDLKRRTPEENALMREDFDDKKADLKNEWSEKNGVEWPTYNEDVYSSNGRLIRKSGADYDAHHIQPLSMGGMNEAENITPLSAENHYDRQGVHSPESPYSQLEQMLGEM